MKKRFILLVLCVLFAGYLVRIPSVSAYTRADLTITPGASGDWDIEGYDFNRTGYGTKAGFRPLDAVDRFSWIVWLRFDDVETGQIICGQWEDALHQARFYISGDTILVQIGDGTQTETLQTADLDFNPLALQMLTVAWDKDLNSGKISLWVNVTEYVSGSGIIIDTSATADFIVGSDHSFTDIMYGSIFSLRLFESKLLSADVSYYLAMGPDYTDPILWHYWPMNEGGGSTMYDNPGIWRLAQEVNFTLDMPGWILTQTVIFGIVIPFFEGGINVLISLAGLALIPVSTGYLAKGGRSELSLKKLEVFFLMFFMGWAMFLGGILA